MKKAALLFAILIFASASVFAQDLLKKAETNPLDCAFYLQSKEKPDNRDTNDVWQIALAYFEANRYEDAFSAVNLFEDADNRVRFFMQFSKRLFENGKRNEAGKFFTEAVKNVDLEADLARHDLIELVQILIEANRADESVKIAEIYAGEFEANDVSLAIAEKFLKTGQTEKLNDFFAQPYFPHESENNPTRARTALIYAKLKQTDKAKKILEEIKQTAFLGETENDANNNRREILFPLLRIHLELGETEKAFELWNQHGDQEDFYEFSQFIDDLIAYSQKEKVLPLIAQMQSDKERFKRDGHEVVKAYLKIGDVETALYAAKTMSDEDDNYWQQDSFMTLADRFIADGRSDLALDILDFAFQRARKIVFEHQPAQSTGASSGSRKTIYFRNIFKRLMKLKRFDKALAVVNSIDSNHWMAKKFVLESLADFAGQQIKTLPRKRIEMILAQIRTIFTDDDDVDDFNDAKLLAAGIYAQMGEKQKAVELLAAILEESDDEDLLLSAGKVFEQNKLKADATMKKILREFIKDAG